MEHKNTKFARVEFRFDGQKAFQDEKLDEGSECDFLLSDRNCK
jgi:hypothetical protein